MRSLQSLFCVLLLASVASSQTAQSPSESEQKAAKPAESQSAKPADNGPPVDEAKVTAGVFQSAYFKFTYQLPKDWKALDDAIRVAANKQLQEEEIASQAVRVRKRPTSAKPASTPASQPVPPSHSLMENYSLLVASPTGVPSLESAVLPRVNIWAKRRIAPLDHIEDPAQFMTATRYTKVLVKPEHVTFDGHDFVRAEIEMPTGECRAQFVTISGDYFVGFEFHASSQSEGAKLPDSMKTVKFQ
jgi:hypothetical protein